MNNELGPDFARCRPFFYLVSSVGDQEARAQSHYAEDFTEIMTASLRCDGPHERDVGFTLRGENGSSARHLYALSNRKAVGKREEVQPINLCKDTFSGLEGNHIVAGFNAEPQILRSQVVDQAAAQDSVAKHIARESDDQAFARPHAFDNSGSGREIIHMFVKKKARSAPRTRANFQQFLPRGERVSAHPAGSDSDIHADHRGEFFRSGRSHGRIPGVGESQVQAAGEAALQPLYFGFRLRHDGCPLALDCTYCSSVPHIFAEGAMAAASKVVEGLFVIVV
jgi:hypothetical protein